MTTYVANHYYLFRDKHKLPLRAWTRINYNERTNESYIYAWGEQQQQQKVVVVVAYLDPSSFLLPTDSLLFDLWICRNFISSLIVLFFFQAE